MTTVEVIGSGVAGLCAAAAFSERGCCVRVVAASDGIDRDCCSWWAGGMLAPGCEGESAEPAVALMGRQSMAWWAGRRPAPDWRGSLVVAAPRDRAELERFARLTEGHARLDAAGVAALEPALGRRFARALFFADEGHLDPRAALAALRVDLGRAGVVFERAMLDGAALASPPEADWRIDCRGLAARDVLNDLRGVRGEMALVRAPEVGITRTVRMLHPRFPLYVVPRDAGVYMIGATVVESGRRGPVTVRSTLELLSAAHALDPAFAEAEVLELGADLRPAFPDNLPRLVRRGRTLHINGLYRHGFLCAPALAARAVALAIDGQAIEETRHDGDQDHRERQSA